MKQMRTDNSLGYCTKCGIVYFLGNSPVTELQERSLNNREIAPMGEKRIPPETELGTQPIKEQDKEAPKGHWICPDCGTRFDYADVSDLPYIEREHFREFHPNRMTP